jgi:signal peptidase I
MAPTFKNGERHWVSPLLMWWRGVSRGDVVAVQTTGRHVMYLKRVLGLPGETVRIAKGEVLINGQAIDEPYIPRRAPWNWPTNGTERLLGAGEFFVVGDNRTMRVDSHYFGVAERPRILGKLVR